MGEFKIEEVDSNGKSPQQIEKDLLDNHAKEATGVVDVVEDKKDDSVLEIKTEEVITPSQEIDDEVALNYLRKKYNQEDLTYDSLLQVKIEEKEVIKEVERELPADVSAFFKYKQETGRGMKDYVKSVVDVSAMPDDKIIAKDIALKNPEFDSEDVKFEMNRLFGVDDMDDESDSRQKSIAKKRRLGEARQSMSDHYEKYKTPLESSDGLFSMEDRDLLKKAKSEQLSQKEISDLSAKKQEFFSAKTNELFSDKFKGFEFTVGEDKSKSFEVEDVAKTRENQLSALNFVNSHLDEDGMLKDAKKYHKALYAATNADKLVKWAYELGASEAVESDAREAKNIDMGRNKPQSGKKDGVNVVEVNNSGSNIRKDGGLRIMGKK
jgi:hypothetical protein